MGRNKNCCRWSNYTVDICFTVMLYRQDIKHGEDWVLVSHSQGAQKVGAGC